jgi:ribokinase
MKVLSFGSINIDYVYHLDEFVKKGETLPCKRFERYLGGKGANQSIAIAIAGVKEVYHAGKIGKADAWLADDIKGYGVNTSMIKMEDGPSGHAIIQMNQHGENCIVTFGGANQTMTEEYIRDTFSRFKRGDFMLIQNELNLTEKIIEEGHKRGFKIFINASPVDKKMADYPLDLIDYVIANEVEAEALADGKTGDDVLDIVRPKFPNAVIIVTLGADGAICSDTDGKRYKIPAPKVKVVATTSAGDTFAGYLVSSLYKGKSVEESLRLACKAAALCVTREGTTNSIPRADEVDSWNP